MKLLDRVLSGKSKEFFDGIEAHPYQYRDDKVEKGADNFRKKDTMNRSLAEHAEVLGCALQAEMEKTGKPFSEKMFKSMERKFKLYKSDDEKFKNLNMPNIYSLATNIAAVKSYLIETWKHGEEFGLALGYPKESIKRRQESFLKMCLPEEERKPKSDFVQTTTRSDVKSY